MVAEGSMLERQKQHLRDQLHNQHELCKLFDSYQSRMVEVRQKLQIEADRSNDNLSRLKDKMSTMESCLGSTFKSDSRRAVS